MTKDLPLTSADTSCDSSIDFHVATRLVISKGAEGISSVSSVLGMRK